MNFESAVEQVLKWEGGYSNHTSDKGGETALKTLDPTLADKAFETVLGRTAS